MSIPSMEIIVGEYVINVNWAQITIYNNNNTCYAYHKIFKKHSAYESTEQIEENLEEFIAQCEKRYRVDLKDAIKKFDSAI